MEENKMEVLYAGKRLNQSDKLFDRFFIVEKGVLDERLEFSDINHTFSVGCVYKITKFPDNKYIVSNREFLYRYEDTEEQKNVITKFSLEHNAAKEAFKMNKMIKNLTSKNPTIEHLIKPLKEINHTLTRQQKQALLAYLIKLLT